MNTLNRSLLLCVCILMISIAEGQNSLLDKKVNLPVGQTILKTALKSVSNQTGCVFSYDPTKIADNQPVHISSKGAQSLRAALLEILPGNIQYKITGKYIVLQQGSGKTNAKAVPNGTKLPKTVQIKRIKGTIDDNPHHERLVLPPLINQEYEVAVPQLVTQIKPDVDSLKAHSAVIVADTLSGRQMVSDELKPVENKPDTTGSKITAILPKGKSGFGGFLDKNAYLETGATWNQQLGTLSIHAGLYNIYSIFSIGSDYHDSYLVGIGMGAKVKLDNHFSLNFDLLKNSLIAGKSYLLNVRASNTQLSPVLNLTVLKSFKFFAGPTLNLIKSSYQGDMSSSDLGVLVGIGFSAGIKIDLKSLISRHS